MNLKRAVNYLRETRTHLNQGQVAIEADIEPGNFSRMLKGSQAISLTQLQAIAKILKSSVSELAAIAEGGESESLPVLKSPRKGYTSVSRLNVEGSAGPGKSVEYEEVIEELWINETWLRRVLGVMPGTLRIITARGDSMMPTIGDGDPLLVDSAVNRIRGNEIYAINWRGDLIIKRIQLMLSGDLVIKSDNSSYEAERISQTEAESLIVAGRVVWVWRGYRL